MAITSSLVDSFDVKIKSVFPATPSGVGIFWDR